jgi:hypothetical protein
MKNNISQMDDKYYSGNRTVVTFDEKKRWIELWPSVRGKVSSNLEAYQVLSGIGLRYRDPRTIKSHMEKLLPLINTKAISAIISFTNCCESHMPVKEFMRLLRERLPAEELGPELAKLADDLIKELPSPTDILKVEGFILSGGFPFDNTQDFK